MNSGWVKTDFFSYLNKAFWGLFLSALVGMFFSSCTCQKESNTKSNSLQTSNSSGTPSEIVIGQYGTMTGSEATFGISTDEGVQLAVEEINAAGGIKGRKVRVVTMDDQGKPEEAAAVVTRLIEQEKAVAIIGEVATGRSLAAAPIAQLKKIPMITPSSTDPKVTEVGDYIFRVCFIDPFQGFVMVKFATENLKLKKFAILQDVKSDYSVGLAGSFLEHLKTAGGEVVASASYQSGDVDFKAQLTQIKSLQPEAIYIPGYYTDVGLISRQAREIGIKVPLLGGDGWDSPKLSEIGKTAIDGAYFSNHFSNESTEAAAVKYIAAFKNKYKHDPDGLSSAGYDATKVLMLALEKSIEITGPEIRKQLALIKDYEGVTGKMSIDEKRNAKKSAVIVQVNGSRNKYIATIEPTN